MAALPNLLISGSTSVFEGNAGVRNVTFTVLRTGNLRMVSSVEWALTGSVDGADFVGGVVPRGKLSFPMNVPSARFVIAVLGDKAFEPDDQAVVTLKNAVNAIIVAGSATLVIRNDDAAPKPPPPAHAPPPVVQPAPAPTPIPGGSAIGPRAPDGTRLGGLLFEETWRTLDFWDPLKGTGRWSTTAWRHELVGANWDNVGQVSGDTMADQKTWYINRGHAIAQRLQPWKLGDGYVDLIADRTPADLLDMCDKKPVFSGALNTWPSFSFIDGYVEFDAQLVVAAPPPWGGIWPACWLRPQFAKQYPGVNYDALSNGQKDLPETDTVEVMDPWGKETTATFHRDINGERDWQAHLKAYPTGDVRDIHRYGTVRTPAWEISYVDGVEVGRRAMTPDARVHQHLVINMGMGGAWPERNGQYPLDLMQAPWTWRVSPIRVYSLL